MSELSTEGHKPQNLFLLRFIACIFAVLIVLGLIGLLMMSNKNVSQTKHAESIATHDVNAMIQKDHDRKE